MADRETLHRLVDSLPEAALEPAQKGLEHMQVWPPPPLFDEQKRRASALTLEIPPHKCQPAWPEIQRMRELFPTGWGGAGQWVMTTK